MGRLIYAKALTKRTDHYPPYISDTVRKELRYVPTVDAVEVVRCEDCKHYWKNTPSDNVPVCLASPRDDAYCSEGERKDGSVD